MRPTLVLNADRLVAGKDFRLAVTAEIQPGWHVNSHKPNEEYLIPTEVTMQPADGLTFGAVQYPPHKEAKLAFSAKPLAVYEGKVVFRVDGTVAATAAPGTRRLVAALEYQPCNDQQCLPPARVEVAASFDLAPPGSTARTANEGVVGGTSAAPARAAAPFSAPAAGGSRDPFAGRSLLVVLGLVFLSGLALNLTPCVYPLIPITVSFFSRQSEGKPARTFGLALVYVLGMSVTYSALGVFAALSGSLFGAWLQKPAVLVGIAAIVVALALSMFGLFEIQAPHFITDRTGSKGGALGALTMGLFVGFVAAPCIGPFVLSLLTYVAQRGSAPLGFGLFFTLAMGLGLPYLVLGTASGSLKALPRSGDWMVSVRKVFGFVLLSLAVYFLRSLLPEKLFGFALAAPLLVGGVYFLIFERTPQAYRWFRALKGALAALLLGAGVLLAIPRRVEHELTWAVYSDTAVEAATEAGKPALIDFYADWCLPCKELDHKTFSDPRVVDAAAGWVLLKADLSREGTPEVSALREKWAVKGVPTLILLGPDGKERGERVVGFEPPEEFAKRLR